MKIHLSPHQPHTISHYSANSVTVQQVSYHQPLFLTADKIVTLPTTLPERPSKLNIEDFQEHINHCDLILIGHRSQALELNPNLQIALYQRGVALEMMTVAAACRTFNLLLSEDRAVGCLLML